MHLRTASETVPATPAEAHPTRAALHARLAPIAWFVLGGTLLLLAQHGNPGIGIAAWIFAIPLLRFARSVSVLGGTLALLVVHAVAATAWTLSIQLPTDGFPLEAVLGAIALNALLVLPFLVDRLVAVRLRERHALLATLVFPTARVGVELLVAAASPFGVVFGMLSSTQHEALPLLQVASVTGAYGVSFLVAWAAPAVVELWQTRRRWRPLAVVGATVVLVLAGGQLSLWGAAPTAETVRVAGITPSPAVTAAVDALPGAEEVVHGDPAALAEVMDPVTDELLASTAREAEAGAAVIVWSEAATRTFEDDVDELYARIGEVAAEHGVHVLATAALYTDEAPYGRNVAAMIGPDGSLLWEYDKTHPLAGMEPIEPGTDPVPSTPTEHGVLAGMICYDLDFATSQVAADILLVPAADWPGFDVLHTQLSGIRAIEQGYSLVRQDAYGTATAFDPQGRVLASVDYHRTDQQTLVVELPTAGRQTIYAVVGDVFAWSCLAMLGALVLAATVSGARARRRTS